MKSSRAFTLIELLVVISIIGLLSSVVLGSLNSARGAARDAKRISELTSLNKAIQAWMVCTGSNFDSVSGTHFGSPLGCRGGGTSDWSVPLAPLIAGNYTSYLPQPLTATDCYSLHRSIYVSPANPGSVFACGDGNGNDSARIGNWYYALVFTTERPISGFPAFYGNVANTGPAVNTYCILGPAR